MKLDAQGNCWDAFGEHTVPQKQHAGYLDGYIYRGEVVNGRKHGAGRISWQDGRTYDGEWSDDARHGIGATRGRTGAPYTTLFLDNVDMKRRLKLELAAHEVDQASDILTRMAAAKLCMKDQLIFKNVSVVHICVRLNQWPVCARALSYCTESERKFLIDMPESGMHFDSPLRLACRLGQKEFLVELLRAGCDVSTWDPAVGASMLADAHQAAPGDVSNIVQCIQLVEAQQLWMRRRSLVYVLSTEPWVNVDTGVKVLIAAYL